MDIRIDLTHTLSSARRAGFVNRRWILCPWLQRFPEDTGIWLSVLAAHDANGALFDALRTSGKPRPDVYAAVFAVDPFRSADEIIRRIKESGVGGVINLPSISFIDGAAGTTFDKLSLGVERELEFLTGCAAGGLRVAGIVRTVAAAERVLAIGADFLVAHGGPPTSADPDPSVEAAERIGQCARSKPIPVVALSSLARPGQPHRSPGSSVEVGGPKRPPYRTGEKAKTNSGIAATPRVVERGDV